MFNNLEQIIQQNPPLAFFAVFAAGVVVSFTPCVYPVIPLTLGYIGARSAGGRWKGLGLSLIYVLGMALTYAVLGAFAAMTGKFFGQVGSSPITYFIVANICLFLGLSMIGVFKLPQMALVRPAQGEVRKGLLGVLFVGIAAGLIVGPCTAPALAAILLYVGSQQNIPYGFSLLFAFGYGVGFLLILLGTFTGLIASMPKSGRWLEWIEKGFGWFLIFTAEYLFIKAGGLWV